jgi:hypothetical protein
MSEHGVAFGMNEFMGDLRTSASAGAEQKEVGQRQRGIVQRHEEEADAEVVEAVHPFHQSLLLKRWEEGK